MQDQVQGFCSDTNIFNNEEIYPKMTNYCTMEGCKAVAVAVAVLYTVL